MLRALGDTHSIHGDRTTCDHCNNKGVPYESLFLITKKGKRSRQQKGKRSRSFDEDDMKQLEKKLKEERDNIVMQSVGLRMLGKEGVCHSHTLNELCKLAPTVHTSHDIARVSGLRPQLREQMFNIIADSVQLD